MTSDAGKKDEGGPARLPHRSWSGFAATTQADVHQAWRQVAGGGRFEITDLPPTLTVDSDGWQVGSCFFTDSTHPKQTLTRTAGRARWDGADDFMVSIDLGEEGLARFGDMETPVHAGRVMVWDLAKPAAKHAGAGRTLCLTLPRDLLSDVLTEALDGLHVLTLGAMGPLFAEHLVLLLKHLPRAPAEAGPGIARSTAELLAACVRPSVGTLEQARETVGATLLQRARREVGRRLDDPELSPDQLALAVGVSRTTLYRIFEPLGGVGGYIRERRLARAWRTLSDPGDGRRIGEIAYAVGFRSEAQFSRAFRQRFGSSPGEVRRFGAEAGGSR